MANNEANKAYREKSHELEKAENNIIFETWTGSWGVKVYPYYEKDKLIFSFIEKGASGAGKSFDIWVDTLRDNPSNTCFDDWAYDILHDRRFESILAAEAKAGEKYPKYFRFTTGDNGDKSIGICNSTSGGYCLNASVPGEKGKVFCNIPLNFHSLRHMAENFIRSYESRRCYLEEIRKGAEKKMCEERAKYSKKNNGSNNDSDIRSQSQSQTPAPNTAATQQPQPQSEPKMPTAEQQNTSQANTYLVTTKGPVKKQKNLFYVPVTDGKNDFTLCFDEKKLPEDWSKFQEMAPNGVKVKVDATLDGKNLGFIQFTPSKVAS